MSGNINRQLRDAAQEGNLKQVRALLAQGADINAAERIDGSTPLLLAMAEGHQKVWRHLLDAGARADVKTELGATAMHVAAGAGDSDALETLLGLGLSIESKDSMGHTPLIEAVESGPDAAVEWLLKHGADPNACDKEGCTSLHAAYIQMLMGDGESDEECERLITLLIKYGADPTVKDKMGRKPKDILKQR
jgi:ankyrin repeat protein